MIGMQEQTPHAEKVRERLQQLSKHLVQGNLGRVLDTAARLPARDDTDYLQETLDSVLRLFEADSGSVMVCKERRHYIAACRGLPDDARNQVHSRRDGTVSSRVIAGQTPVILHGPVDRHEWPKAIPRTHLVSSISVPLLNRRKVVGLLNINSSSAERLFTDDELAFASIIGRHLAISMENVKLREEAKERSRYFSDLYKIARTITSSLDLDLVLQMIAQHVQRVTACDVCVLLLHNPDTGSLQLARGHGIPNAADEDYINLVAPAAKQTYNRHRLFSTHADFPLPDDLGLRSGIVVPLTIKRKVVGYIAGYRFDARGFSQATTRLLLGLAELAAIAIENARLYRRQSGIAHITQRELTPERFEPMAGYEIGSKYTPAHQVGGDYLDLIRIDKHRFGLVVADVAGRNVTAALHIAKCKHAIRVLADCISSPARIMVKLNKFIYEHTDPEAFISMFYSVLDSKKGTLTYSVAGHEPGLLLRADQPGIEQVRASGILLGVDPSATFEERATYLSVGDILLLYTDGLTEALSSRHEDGLEALEAAFLQRRLEPAQRLADNIHGLAISNQAGNSPDDIAIVTLRKM